MKEVQITSGSGILCGTIFSSNSSSSKLGVLLVHGWTSAQDRMYETAEILSQELDAVCLTVDLRGHGKTGGNLELFSRKNFLDDVLAAYDFLVSQPGVDKKHVGVIGSSFGGYLAALLTAQRNLSWVVLRVPADYPDLGFTESKLLSPDSIEWRQSVRAWDTTDALRSIHSFKGSILLVESEKDEVIPHQTLLNYKNAAQCNLEYVVMKNAPHSITRHSELRKEFNQIVLKSLKNKLFG